MSLVYDCRETADRARGLAAATAAVRRGDLVVLPTDTVYGLATDAFSHAGVEKLRQVKGRGRDLPVPVMIGARRVLDSLAATVPAAARDLAEAFWPGPLTLVVRTSTSLTWDLGDGSGNAAIRMPLHPVALELLRETGPLAVSTANSAGRPAAADVMVARGDLTEAVSVYLEGGPSPAGPTSSVVDVTGAVPRLVRAGALSLEMLRDVVPDVT